MGLFGKSTKIDLLQKTQENLEATHNNTLLMTQLLQQQLPSGSIASTHQWTDEEKWRAAYALNLCTVSISQIIEYNDVNFMEREYEAILNNLNLEEMPKDESLLQILKQILDVITFFRIQDGDKKLLEKEYQQKMKNAIWNAVPSLSIITTGGNPFSIAISLAAQVGIGYMNYRREKAQITLEQERKEWELQRSAIEQLNGLRRELFDTAWRLADTYDFRDELRITERQISQYNKILLDPDDMRRYERLLYVQNKFEAYPPYWYYLGSAANSVFLNPATPENIRLDFKLYASEHFEHYLKSIINNSLLREDHLAASCALEYFDLLDDGEYEKKLYLLQTAEEYSGNALDVLEICAFSYLKIGETEKASTLFRMLINENYNQKINAQILSRIYVYDMIINNSHESPKLYDTLKLRAPDVKLFPLPQNTQQITHLEETFVFQQKIELKQRLAEALESFIIKYENRYYTICNWNRNISNEIVELISHVCNTIEALFHLQRGNGYATSLRKDISKLNEYNKLIRMLENSENRTIIPFKDIMSSAFLWLSDYIIDLLRSIKNISEISELESDLDMFIEKEYLSDVDPEANNAISTKQDSLLDSIFGTDFEKAMSTNTLMDKCLKIVHNDIYKTDNMLLEQNNKVSYLIKGSIDFTSYIKRNSDIDNNITFAILDAKSGIDLIFTTKGIRTQRKRSIVSYSNITTTKKQNTLQIGSDTYKNNFINMNVLFDMIKELDSATKNTIIKNSLANDIYNQIQNSILIPSSDLPSIDSGIFSNHSSMSDNYFEE